jgi:outer membrane autotransporter protein
MKFKKIITIIKMSVLLMLSNQALALPELSFNPSATLNDYPGMPLGQVFMNFEILNTGADGAGDGVDFILAYNETEFFFNSGLSTLDLANGWSCFQETGQLRCNGQAPAGYSFLSTLVFDIGSTTAPNTYPFNGQLIDISGLEGNTNDNSIATSITVSVGGGSPDYELLVGSATPSPINIDPQDLTPIPFEFELTNIGTSAGFGIDEFITIAVADNFTLSGVTMTSLVGTSTWNCSMNGISPPFDNDWDCINNDSLGGMQISDIAKISGNIATFETGFDTPGAIVASLFPSSDLNTSNNIANIDTSIVFPPSDPDVVVDMQLVSGFVPGNKGGIFAPQGDIVSYKIAVNALDTDGGQTRSMRNNNSVLVSPPANNVVITHTIPAGLTFDSISNIVGPNLAGACSQAAGVITCNIASLPVTIDEDSFEINVLVGGTEGDNLLPTASVTASNDFDTNNNTAQLPFITIAGIVDLTMQKVAQNLQGAAQTNFAEGEDFQYRLTVTNASNFDVGTFDAKMIDDVPSGLVIGNFTAPTGWDCSLSNIQVNHIECDNSSPILANTSVDFIIPVSTLVEDQYTNSAIVFFQTFSDPLLEIDISNNDASTSVNVGTQTTIEVDIDTLVLGAPVQSVSDGSDFTYRVSVTNTGLFDANMIDFIEEMPSGVTVNGFTGSGWSCTNQGLNYFCDFPGPLAVGATTFVDFSVTESGSGTVLTNMVNAQALNAPLVSDTITSFVTNVSFDVNVTQNPNPIEEGQPFDIIVDIVNTGSEPIEGAQIVNTLPEGFSYDTQTKSSTCAVAGQVMTCTVDNPIAIGASESIIFGIQAIATSNTSTIYTNTVTVSGVNIPVPFVIETVTNVNPTGSGSGSFNYNVVLDDSSDPNEVNTPFDYVVTINNTGASNITFMDVELNIPSDLTINSMMADGFNCTSTSFGLSCDSDQTLDIAPDESKEIIIVNVQSNGFTGDVNTDVIAKLGTVIQRTDDEVTTIIDSGIGILSPDISVDIIAGDAIDQGAVSEFEVKIANSGPDVAEDVALNMSISGILDTVSVVPGADWSCQVNALNINCQFNDESMPVNHQSSLFVTANTSLVVIDAEDLILSATLTTSSSDTDLSNNTDSSQVAVSGTPLEGEIGDALRSALGSTGNPQVDSAIQGIAGFCEVAYYTAIEGLCSDIYDAALAGETETVRTAIEQIMPNEVIGQSTSVSEIATAQFRNIGSRLSQVRGGGGSGFSSAGLNARYGNGSIPLGMLAYLNQTDEETNGIDTNNDFISPWGFFINGTISMGDRDATSRELGFDFDTFGITAGVDYRLDAKKVVGVALGYAKFDSTIENVSELNSSGVTLTGYGSFYVTDNFYVDARISYAQPEFDQSRNIDFTVGSTHIDRTALGKTDADQYSLALSAGYSFYKNAWNITPNASISYMKTTIDEFAETGAGDFNFVYLEQELESLVWSAGIRVSKAISLKNGVITPQFDFDYNYEGLNDGNDIQTRFVSAPDDQLLIVVTDSPDRSYGSAGLGLVFISANGKQAYINYRSVFGLDGFSRGTFNLGARFEF